MDTMRKHRRPTGIPRVTRTIQVNNSLQVDSIPPSASDVQAAGDQTADTRSADIKTTPVPSAPPLSSEEANSSSGLFSLNGDSIVKGIIYSEIFGRPRALRRGRW